MSRSVTLRDRHAVTGTSSGRARLPSRRTRRAACRRRTMGRELAEDPLFFAAALAAGDALAAAVLAEVPA